jgi:hypothetical protein
MRRSDEHVRILRNFFCLTIGTERALKIAFQVISETEVVPDVRLQSTRGNVARVGQSVWFDLIWFAGNQF